jgi:hypothetical protein
MAHSASLSLLVVHRIILLGVSSVSYGRTASKQLPIKLAAGNMVIIIIIIPGKYSIFSLQKTAILETSHIIRKLLQCEA